MYAYPRSYRGGGAVVNKANQQSDRRPMPGFPLHLLPGLARGQGVASQLARDLLGLRAWADGVSEKIHALQETVGRMKYEASRAAQRNRASRLRLRYKLRDAQGEQPPCPQSPESDPTSPQFASLAAQSRASGPIAATSSTAPPSSPSPPSSSKGRRSTATTTGG